jgi:GAF domain-containing protein
MSDLEPPGTDEIASDDADLDPSADLARHLADIATVLLAPGAVTAAERIVSLAVQTMDSCDDAGLCGARTQPSPLEPSALMTALERLQTDAEQGPCQEVLAGLALVYVPDLLDDQRWPLFSPAAARLGMRSALAYRLQVEGETLGALQLYAHLPGAFNARERAQGLIFASYAALALTLARDRQAEETRIGNLETALTSREIIGQAQGILMERERITADQAFQLLRLSSQHLNRKLSAVAQDIVDTGTTPPEATRA